jgi:predicted GH43/DUF377 family glycosyl hydrolase
MDMSSPLAAAVAIAGVTLSGVAVLLAMLAIIFGFAALFFAVRRTKYQPAKLALIRASENPLLEPRGQHWWESEAVFNPAAFVHDGRVHVLYRAMGGDGVSRIGYASSADGVHFDERLPFPVYDRGPGFDPKKSRGYWRPLSYNTDLYASGGGWGGCEDPRAVCIDDHLYMTFGIFECWQSMRLAVTALPLEKLKERLWHWAPHVVMSPKDETHKNWVLFPEKINGKFAILHALTPEISIEYVDEIASLASEPIQSNNQRSGRKGAWDAFVRGAAAPPLRTADGWLLLYHGMNPAESAVGYKVGAMLLDLDDPTKILYRTEQPILEPTEWYENDGKPGVVYASGAVILGDDLLVYYGGGDKRIAVARANLADFLAKLKTHKQMELKEA